MQRLLLTLVFFTLSAQATPPDYATFNREQQVNVPISEAELLRIWMIFVGQGDGILIELPDAYDSDRPDLDSGTTVVEPTNVLIDAGSFRGTNATRAESFLNTLYPDGSVIEHAVISHHDADHVRGFTAILENEEIDVDAVYHNGLASYLPGRTIAQGLPAFPNDACPENSICKEGSSRVTRGMARLDQSGNVLEGYLINNRGELESRQEAFQGVYANLAEALLDDIEPEAISRFERVHHGDAIPIGNQGDVQVQVVWPRPTLREYDNDWGKTINGNSVSLHLSYGNFDMLFTGDHNDESEPDMMSFLNDHNQSNRITDIDVLKVPHHGSSHSDRNFFGSVNEHGTFRPFAVLAVASMGEKGFLSNWRHPRTETIRWAGGSHRFYSTLIHERRFNYSLSTTQLRNLIERDHILIETDGTWFRVVEVPVGGTLTPRRVDQVGRSDGTRWICARRDNAC